jgi:hypothetical protein
MYFARNTVFLVLVGVANFSITKIEVQLNSEAYAVQNVTHRDFAIIGGDSTGIHSAIRLRDLNNTIHVVNIVGKADFIIDR